MFNHDGEVPEPMRDKPRGVGVAALAASIRWRMVGRTKDGGPIRYPGLPEITRNGPCPCGSGKKAKRCCLDPARSNAAVLAREGIAAPASILAVAMTEARCA